MILSNSEKNRKADSEKVIMGADPSISERVEMQKNTHKHTNRIVPITSWSLITKTPDEECPRPLLLKL